MALFIRIWMNSKFSTFGSLVAQLANALSKINQKPTSLGVCDMKLFVQTRQ